MASTAPRRRRGIAPRSQFPWEADEVCRLADLVRDGVPPKSVGLLLGRSHESILQQMKLLMLRTDRLGAARQVVFNLKSGAAAVLEIDGAAMHMNLNRYCRYLLELLARETAFRKKLVDMESIAERHDALPLTDPRPLPASTGAAAVVPEPSQAAPVAPAFTIALSSVQLEGRLYG